MWSVKYVCRVVQPIAIANKWLNTSRVEQYRSQCQVPPSKQYFNTCRVEQNRFQQSVPHEWYLVCVMCMYRRTVGTPCSAKYYQDTSTLILVE